MISIVDCKKQQVIYKCNEGVPRKALQSVETKKPKQSDSSEHPDEI